jgi:hypothetical protein
MAANGHAPRNMTVGRPVGYDNPYQAAPAYEPPMPPPEQQAGRPAGQLSRHELAAMGAINVRFDPLKESDFVRSRRNGVIFPWHKVLATQAEEFFRCDAEGRPLDGEIGMVPQAEGQGLAPVVGQGAMGPPPSQPIGGGRVVGLPTEPLSLLGLGHAG